MEKQRLKSLLNAEVDAWSRKPYSHLIEELSDVVAHGRGTGPEFHQFEVQLLENNPDYLHVCVSIDDGSLARSAFPLTHSFIVHRDGRVEK